MAEIILHPEDDIESAGRRYVEELRDEIAYAPWDTPEQRREILNQSFFAYRIEQIIEGFVEYAREKKDLELERASTVLLSLSANDEDA
jgi:hypothetical protein